MKESPFGISKEKEWCSIAKLKVSTISEPTAQIIDALVVVDEVTDAVVNIDTTICLPELAQKIDKIDASVRNLECEVVTRRIIIRGTLHLQIYYVNKNDRVVHHGMDLPFTNSITVDSAEEGMTCQINDVNVEIDFQLQKASRLQIFAAITLGSIKIMDEEQLCLPQLGGIQGTIKCHNNDDEILLARLDLHDDEGRLIDHQDIFRREINEQRDCKSRDKVEFRFVSLPPGRYRLKLVILCCFTDDMHHNKPPLPWFDLYDRFNDYCRQMASGDDARAKCGSKKKHHDDDFCRRASLYCDSIDFDVEACQITVLDITMDDRCDCDDLNDLFKEFLAKSLLFFLVRDEFRCDDDDDNGCDC